VRPPFITFGENYLMKQLLLSLLILISLSVRCQSHQAKIETNYGAITIMLYDETPKHRNNFIKLAERKYFDSLLFHRVIKDFVIQAGDPYSKFAKAGVLLGDSDLGYTIPAEILPDKYYHKRGAVGMARDDNPAMASSACQFYIVQGKIAADSTFAKAKKRTNGYEIPDAHKEVYKTQGGIPHLDARYTVFGEVMDGMDVVDKIAAVKTDKNDRPLEDVRIIRVIMIK
jgi:cyclophilin family peptidyl-prolyl cis-trans isomerase